MENACQNGLFLLGVIDTEESLVTVTSHQIQPLPRQLLVRDNKTVISARMCTPMLLLVRKKTLMQLDHLRAPTHKSYLIQRYRTMEVQKCIHGYQDVHGSTVWKTENHTNTQNS